MDASLYWVSYLLNFFVLGLVQCLLYMFVLGLVPA